MIFWKMLLNECHVISDAALLLKKIQRIEVTLVDRLISQVSSGERALAMPADLSFSQFLSTLTDAYGSDPRIKFVLLHVHVLANHRLRLQGAWESWKLERATNKAEGTATYF